MAVSDTLARNPAIDSREAFRNEPLLDFSQEENVRRMRQALAAARSNLGREYPLVIAGKPRHTAGKIHSVNPAHPGETVGIFAKAGQAEVAPAMDAALAALEGWKRTSTRERAGLLLEVARILRERRFEFMAWMVLEVGKNWAEADADFAELIDFAEYYARQALRLDQAEPDVQLPGERDLLRYIPLGVGVVIPPWNFPAAIMGGMTLASIACGNTVVLKPSSDSPAVAAKFFEVLEQAGMPPGVVNFCPGAGESFGDALVSHPQTRYIAFTGSRAVGIRINQAAAVQAGGQRWIKRVILEMGGKNAILVDEDADLDAAVEGVAASAFGYQGQKCSACSRLILPGGIHDQFLERLKERVERIPIGDPGENFSLGPVINQGAMRSILQYMETGKSEGRLVTGGGRAAPAGDGYFLQPTIFSEVKAGARIEQEEIFGPVLAVIRCRSFEHGLEIANGTEYGLTGAVYSRSEEKVERAMREFHVGNLYVNRKSTGAIVGAHPFGGFNMSGTDSKAGGPDYLLLFTQAKSIGRKIG